MKKIIVEIDGVRHRLVEDKADTTCDKCSLHYECETPICQHFAGFGNCYCHFEKEEVCG